MTQTDEECVKLSLNGHPEAFEPLVGRYWAPLLSYLAGRLRDREWAQEAAQEAFVRSFLGLKGLRKPASFFSWLFGIADRVVKEQQRARRRNEQRSDPPWQEVVQHAQSQDYDLERAVAALPEVYRQVILLRYYGNLSCAQVAEGLAIPLGTVTKRLSRAYAMLRVSLREVHEPQQSSEVQR
jgi:RNA polymerase sigma-70 factor (ECF subfamily)